MTSQAPSQDGQARIRGLADLIRMRCELPGFAPGGRLPTERRLADELEVTRTQVRQALTVLEAEGRISREVGRGTFLRGSGVGLGPGLGAGPSAPARDGEPVDFSPADVMAVRRLVEPQVLPLVVALATQRDFEEFARCLDGGASAESFEEFEAWDYAFHHAIVAAGRNPLLVTMYGVVERARQGEIWGNLKRRNDSRERRALYQADHVELVDALRAREPERAVAAMAAHLARVHTDLLDVR